MSECASLGATQSTDPFQNLFVTIEPALLHCHLPSSAKPNRVVYITAFVRLYDQPRIAIRKRNEMLLPAKPGSDAVETDLGDLGGIALFSGELVVTR
jgi:hypothetical protein